MFTPEQYRKTATEYKRRASRTDSVNERLEFSALERNYAAMADNEEGLRNNSDHTGKAPVGNHLEDISASEEQHVLRCLGAAVVLQWNTIPRKLQRKLFDDAGAMGDLLHSEVLRPKIARFLHQHKDEDLAVTGPLRQGSNA